VAKNRARYDEALNRGHVHCWDQQWEEAIVAFQLAIDELPGEPAPYAGLGMAHFELEQLKESLANYKQAARLSKGDIIYLRHVADVQERLGLLNEAGQTYMAIGEVQLRRRMLDEAMDNWHRAVRLEPNLLGGHQRLATVYKRQGNTRAAIREYLAIARIFHQQGARDKALQTCHAALELDQRNPDVLTAIELIQHGEEGFLDDEVDGETVADGDKLQTVQRIATAFKQDTNGWREEGVEQDGGPVASTRQLAMEQLAADLFEEGEDTDEALEMAMTGSSKLERDALISQALDFQTRNQIDEAIDCYERAMQGGNTSSAVRFNLALLYQDKLRFDDAMREYHQVVRDPDYRLACHFALGESYRAKGDTRQALHHFVTVLRTIDLETVTQELSDRVSELYDQLVESLMTQDQPERAEHFANALVAFLSKKDWQAYILESRSRLNALSANGRVMILGDILIAGSEQVLESLYLSQQYAQQGMMNTAMEEAYRAIQLSPGYLPAHWQLGELLVRQRPDVASRKFMTIGDTYRSRGDINSAISAYERVADLNPVDVETRGRLISLHKQHNAITQALHHIREMGRAHYQLAQVDRAREVFQEGLKLAESQEPEETAWKSRFLQEIAELDMQRLDWRRALLAYRDLRRLEPNDERIALSYIDLFYKVGQPQYGLRELDRFLIQLVKSGQGARVQKIVEDLVSQRPNDPGLVERLSRLYLRLKRKQDAVDLLDKLGEAQLESGEKTGAKETIARIIELSPPNVAMYVQLHRQL
jgi:tetratricopeptide (TPR) repeat protein